MPATYSSYLRCKSAMWMCFLLHSCIFTMTAQAIKMNINTLDVNVEPKGRNPILSFAGIPVLPIQTAQPSSWTPSKTAACTNGYCGDIRAVVELTANDIQGNTATVQIWWRRRDPRPSNKTVLAVDSNHAAVSVTEAIIESDCGLVTFSRSSGLNSGTYYIYYLPFMQSGGGAGLRFNWQGCDDRTNAESNICVQARRRRQLRNNAVHEGNIGVCNTVTSAATPVVRLENRDRFNKFTVMEQMATSAETDAAVKTITASGNPPPFAAVFPESHENVVRVLDNAVEGRIPIRWAQKIISQSILDSHELTKDVVRTSISTPFSSQIHVDSINMSISGSPGQWIAFQLGIWAYNQSVHNVTVNVENNGFVPTSLSSSSSPIPASALTVVNLAGSDVFGVDFENTQYSLGAGRIGSLWCGFAVPLNTTVGTYIGSLSVGSNSTAYLPSSLKASPVTIALAIQIDGKAVSYGGAGNLSSLARLQWLNSKVGLEDTIPAPFDAVGLISAHYNVNSSEANVFANSSKTGIAVTSLGKVVTLGTGGLPESIAIDHARVRNNVSSTITHELLKAPISFDLFTSGSNKPCEVKVISPVKVVKHLNSSITWTSEWVIDQNNVDINSDTISITLTASLEFTSYLTFNVSILNRGTTKRSLDDVRLTVPIAKTMLGWIVGMDNTGKPAIPYFDKMWRWSNTTGSNKLWIGRPEAGVVLNLKGSGLEWDSPMFGKDYTIIPEIPTTWGGVRATMPNKFGVNVTQGIVVAFSGPRTLAPGECVSFFFDLALTPSKALNWTKHWGIRTRQLGYEVPYASPQAVASMGVSVVTLHQGTQGIINGSLINPWINYPFLNDTVPLLTNYTTQSNALGMAVKMYYTIRELSSRAVEMFAFKAMQGEILVDQDPYTIVQPGYGHNWDQHGGSAYLHQHMIAEYGACWQQTESNGEIDPSMCSRGVSRLFNYYVAGLFWSFNQAPYMNGIYYDGTNFPRIGMIRIRRTVDAAATQLNRGFPPLLDLHTGHNPSPPTCSYASHYPLMDYVWNGEGFDWNAKPAYWLIETSGIIHGLSGDMLGSGSKSIFRGMVFGMTERNADTSRAIWSFWDRTKIAETNAFFGWWDIDDTPAVVAQVHIMSEGNCTWQITRGEYYGLGNTDCGLTMGPTPGCWESQPLEVAQAHCCADPLCVGLSYGVANGQNPSAGCCKADLNGPTKNPNYDGYRRPPAPCIDIYASTWSKYGSHAVVAVASWCQQVTNITLNIDWSALGLDKITANVSLPAIDGVQTGEELSNAGGPFSIEPNDGLLMLIAGPTFNKDLKNS